jgi:Leucine-rich repeat (LRR) protein
MNIRVTYANNTKKTYDHFRVEEYENPLEIIELNCSRNSLSNLPDNIGILSNLKVLNCGSNYLSNLPICIGDLKNLTELYIYNCHMDWISEDIIAKLTKLEVLDCSENELKWLPVTMGYLTHLKELNFSCNYIEYLHDALEDLVNLEVLDCSANLLLDLDDSIGNLINLKELDCSYNHLDKLPDSFVNLTSLKKLNCKDRRIEINPEILSFINSIEETHIDKTEPKQTIESYKINNYVAAQVGKLALLENKTCPVELTPLSDFDKLVVFSCGHVCGKQNRVFDSCPECRNKMGYVILSKEEI